MRIHASVLAGTMLATLSVFPISNASAHASLERAEAQPGSFKAVMRIPHGCDGQATHTVTIDLPEGFIDAKPMPKAGWTLATETGDYAETHNLHGREVTSGVRSVTWSGGDLQDGHYDEFIVAGRISNVQAGAVLSFPTTQLCADGEVAWVELAEEGIDPHSLDYPAPTLTVVAAETEAGEHAHGHAARAHGGHAHGAEAAADAEVQPVTVGDLTISGYWTRATLPNQRVGGGYLTVENIGGDEDRLVAVSSPVTERAEIHEMAVENDVMTMRRLDDGIAIPAGESIALEPGGFHLMFQDLSEGFEEGETVSVTLAFENAGEVTLDLPVLAAGSRQAGGAHEHQH